MLLDDIIKKMNGDEANSQISKPIEEAAKSSASVSALKSVKAPYPMMKMTNRKPNINCLR